MKMDNILQEALKPVNEPSKELNEKLLIRAERELNEEREDKKEQGAGKAGKGRNAIWKYCAAACLGLGIIIPVSIHAYDSQYRPRVERELVTEDTKQTFTIMFEDNTKQAPPELWNHIIHSDACEDYKEYIYAPSAWLEVPLSEVNPQFAEYLHEAWPDYFEYADDPDRYNFDVELVTYEGCDSYILSEGSTPTNFERVGESVNYTGDSIFSYQPGTNITIGVFDMTRIDEEVLDYHDALVYHEICLDNCTNQREWFMYQFDPKQLILTVPYDEFEELWPYQGEGISAVYTYALKAKEGREEELREEIRQIVGSRGHVFEGGYYD